MVVVLPESKLIFIEEPRAGSRTINRFLIQSGLGYTPVKNVAALRHMSVPEFKRRAAAGELDRRASELSNLDGYEFFAILRNPFDTVVTYYVKLLDGSVTKDRVAEMALARRSRAGGLYQFLRDLRREKVAELSEESHLIRLEGVHHLLRYEDGFPQVVTDFLASKGVEITPWRLRFLGHAGKTQGKKLHWKRYYDLEGRARAIVEEIYATFLKRYGYGWES